MISIHSGAFRVSCRVFENFRVWFENRTRRRHTYNLENTLHFKELGLDNRLLKNLKHFDFKQATDIQQQAIPVSIAGKDLLASSKTGSGKTLAFVLPMLHKSLKNKAFSAKDPRGVILAPTRELAKQVYGELRSMLGGLSYEATLIVGGENFNDQVKALRRYPKFIVATPGRLADHLEHRSLYLDGLETLVLDEADRMLDLGFAPELRRIHNAAASPSSNFDVLCNTRSR